MTGPRKAARYFGELAKPIPHPTVVRPRGLAIVDAKAGAKANEEMARSLDDAVRQARRRKLLLLMDHYSIADKSDYLSLALALAVTHVPGFSIKWKEFRLSRSERTAASHGAVMPLSHTGRKREWTDDRLSKLFDDVEATKRGERLATDREALKFLARKNRAWRTPPNHRGKFEEWVETLESRLQDEKRIRRAVDKRLTELTKIADELSVGSSGNISSV